MNQELSNAQPPKYFGQKVIEKNEFEILQILHFSNLLNENGVFVKKFAFFARNLKNAKFQIHFSQWIFVQNTSEIVRLKALDPYFTLLQLTNTYEHFTSIYEHLQSQPKYVFLDFAVS